MFIAWCWAGELSSLFANVLFVSLYGLWEMVLEDGEVRKGENEIDV